MTLQKLARIFVRAYIFLDNDISLDNGCERKRLGLDHESSFFWPLGYKKEKKIDMAVMQKFKA